MSPVNPGNIDRHSAGTGSSPPRGVHPRAATGAREANEWPLVIFTALGPASAGLMTGIAVLSLGAERLDPAFRALLPALAVAVIALVASVLHLEKPLRAYRALLGFPRSALSLEIFLYGTYVFVLIILSLLALEGGPAWAAWPGAVLGLLAALSSARVYRLPARPAWNSPATTIRFVAGGLALGGSVAAAAADSDILAFASDWPAVLLRLIVLAAAVAAGLAFLASSRDRKGQRQVSSGGVTPGGVTPGGVTPGGVRRLRVVAGLLVPMAALVVSFFLPAALLIAAAGLLAGELADRWLFFATQSMPLPQLHAPARGETAPAFRRPEGTIS
ncbi:MAG: hypothetical protein Kow00129_02730 [Thermoleophilia bacterium]